MPGTVIASIVGGIGNQLFCWAAAYAAARRSEAGLRLECGSYKSDAFGRSYRLPDLGVLDAHSPYVYTPVERVAIPILTRMAKRNQGYIEIFGCKVYTDANIGINRNLLDTHLSGRNYLRGYWQSAHYFKEYASDIRQAVTLQPCSEKHRTAADVCVHIRSYNEEKSQTRIRLNKDYYQSAYKRCRERLGHPRFIIYSDNLQWAKERKLLPAKYEVGGTGHTSDCIVHDLCDLVTMSRFPNSIIANSSFSWWGAYLNNAEAWIQAPAYERRCWSFEDSLPTNWEKV
jgi:hypothetical protein